MRGPDFASNHREITRTVNGDPSTKITCNIVDFQNKTIVNLLKNGEMDLSFDIPLTGIAEDQQTGTMGDDYDAAGTEIVPSVLVGGNYNVKNRVAASQIGRLFNQTQSKNLILNMSGRIFKGQDFEDGDYDKLQFLLKLVGDTREA